MTPMETTFPQLQARFLSQVQQDAQAKNYEGMFDRIIFEWPDICQNVQEVARTVKPLLQEDLHPDLRARIRDALRRVPALKEALCDGHVDISKNSGTSVPYIKALQKDYFPTEEPIESKEYGDLLQRIYAHTLHGRTVFSEPRELLQWYKATGPEQLNLPKVRQALCESLLSQANNRWEINSGYQLATFFKKDPGSIYSLIQLCWDENDFALALTLMRFALNKYLDKSGWRGPLTTSSGEDFWTIYSSLRPDAAYYDIDPATKEITLCTSLFTTGAQVKRLVRDIPASKIALNQSGKVSSSSTLRRAQDELEAKVVQNCKDTLSLCAQEKKIRHVELRNLEVKYLGAALESLQQLDHPINLTLFDCHYEEPRDTWTFNRRDWPDPTFDPKIEAFFKNTLPQLPIRSLAIEAGGNFKSPRQELYIESLKNCVNLERLDLEVTVSEAQDRESFGPQLMQSLRSCHNLKHLSLKSGGSTPINLCPPGELSQDESRAFAAQMKSFESVTLNLSLQKGQLEKILEAVGGGTNLKRLSLRADTLSSQEQKLLLEKLSARSLPFQHLTLWFKEDIKENEASFISKTLEAGVHLETLEITSGLYYSDYSAVRAGHFKPIASKIADSLTPTHLRLGIPLHSDAHDLLTDALRENRNLIHFSVAFGGLCSKILEGAPANHPRLRDFWEGHNSANTQLKCGKLPEFLFLAKEEGDKRIGGHQLKKGEWTRLSHLVYADKIPQAIHSLAVSGNCTSPYRLLEQGIKELTVKNEAYIRRFPNVLLKMGKDLEKLWIEGVLIAHNHADTVQTILDHKPLKSVRLFFDPTHRSTPQESQELVSAFIVNGTESLELDLPLRAGEDLKIWKPLFAAIQQSERLKELKLRLVSPIKRQKAFARAFVKACKGCSSLEKLHVTFCDGAGKDFKEISRAFEPLRKLKELHLANVQ